MNEKVIIVSLFLQNESEQLQQESLNELHLLADTAQLDVLDSITQRKERIDPKWFVGKGKLEEIRHTIHNEHVDTDTVIFNQELSGMQVRNLEEVLQVKIIDRTQLILDIFASRAKSHEGKLQVELAQLRYLLPRLVGHGKNLSRLGGGIGTRGPGETQLETDRRHIRTRIDDLQKRLEQVVRHREVHRQQRKKDGWFQAVLVGYTNAGKSTLLKQMTGADAYIEDQLFATLDPSAKLATLPSGKEMIVTDTVGFIRDLPHDLVNAFRSTLEEVLEADLILIVQDATSPFWQDQLRVVNDVLDELGASVERFTVFNKMDAVDSDAWLTTNGDELKISAFDQEDIQILKQKIEDKWLLKKFTIRLPVGEGRLLAQMHERGEVLTQKIEGEFLILDVRMDVAQFNKHRAQIEPYITDLNVP